MVHPQVKNFRPAPAAPDHRVPERDEFLRQRPTQPARNSRNDDFHSSKVAFRRQCLARRKTKSAGRSFCEGPEPKP
jgi:hypothetical protein